MSETTIKTPVRRCVGCGNHFPKPELLRIVNVDGKAVPDFEAKAQSRGTYICKDAKCLKKAMKSGRITTAIKCAVDEAVLIEAIGQNAGEVK